MLYPSIDNLIKSAHSKYSIVTLASKRARNLLEQYNPQLKPKSKKHIGIALEEIAEGILVATPTKK